MLGAHLDSWHTGQGATDNADGVVVVLEAFRILKATRSSPRRTIRVALWGGEEAGPAGFARPTCRSTWRATRTQPARDKLSHVFQHRSGQRAHLWLVHGEQRSGAADLRRVDGAVSRTSVSEAMSARGIGNTDHVSFIRAGMPGFNPVQDYDDYDVREHHTNVDTAERVMDRGPEAERHRAGVGPVSRRDQAAAPARSLRAVGGGRP